jgi:hypothetical protein
MKMDELIKLVSQKTGISEQTAHTAVTTVLNYLKGKLPGPIASQLDSAAGGGNIGGDAVKGLGDLFGKK